MSPRRSPVVCDQVQNLLARYLADDLPPGDRTVVSEHLRACATCREEATVSEELAPVLRRLGTPEPPEGFAERVTGRISREVPPGDEPEPDES